MAAADAARASAILSAAAGATSATGSVSGASPYHKACTLECLSPRTKALCGSIKTASSSKSRTRLGGRQPGSFKHGQTRLLSPAQVPCSRAFGTPSCGPGRRAPGLEGGCPASPACACIPLQQSWSQNGNLPWTKNTTNAGADKLASNILATPVFHHSSFFVSFEAAHSCNYTFGSILKSFIFYLTCKGKIFHHASRLSSQAELFCWPTSVGARKSQKKERERRTKEMFATWHVHWCLCPLHHIATA